MLEDAPTSLENDSFRQLALEDRLIGAVEKSGYTTPTPIQTRAIPILLEGRDLLGQAQTGSGKTAAFALPLLQNLDAQDPRVQVLVLTPTRELAIQVAEAFERYAEGIGNFRVAAIYGGQDYMVQFRKLDAGTQVVVGTPGRVMDHMRRGSLKLDGLRTLVLDEADEMLRMGFAEDVEWVLSEIPEKRQMALFSATLPETIRGLARKYMSHPVEITIDQRIAAADTIRQRYVIAFPAQKQEVLARLLEAEPIDAAIVFVKTKSSTEPLAEFLTHSGHRAAALNGDMPQKQRERIIEHLRGGKLNIIVATDVAARGLDVQRVTHVINYDLPFDSEAYIHRIGRTGRAGRCGDAILFLNPKERGRLKRIEQFTKQAIDPLELPSNRSINKNRVKKFHERIATGLAHRDLDSFASVIEQFRREHSEVTIEQIAAALAVLAQGKKPLLLKEEFIAAEFVQSFSKSDRFRRADGRDRFSERRGERENNRLATRGIRADRDSRAPGRDEGLANYRIEVGKSHQVKPSNIVGALVNEAGIDTAAIGRIQIFDDHSIVDLPSNLSFSVLESLASVRVAKRPMCISRLSHATGQFEAKRPRSKTESKPVRAKKKKRKD